MGGEKVVKTTVPRRLKTDRRAGVFQVAGIILANLWNK